MELKFSAVVMFVLCSCVCAELCPKQCDCDMHNGLNRATCIDQNVIGVDVGVPKGVQVYSLANNVISDLEDFCFKESGYTSLQVLILSYNKIFWIGVHAFSGLDSLVHLDLSYNRLRDVPSDAFWDTPSLQELDLSGNIFESLKNQPFLMHDKLQILNLNNCRIKSIPERLFTRLPKLKKLDLSENYMVTFNIEVLRPLRILERLELKNDYFRCTPDFIAAESYIASRSIVYEKQCTRKGSSMFERIVEAPKVKEKDTDVKDVWNLTDTSLNVTLPCLEDTDRKLTPFEIFDKKFPASQAFLLGLEIGLGIGVVATYLWLRSLCKCRALSCSRPRGRRQMRRLQRVRENDMNAHLLWSNVINPDLETPPLFRRQLSLPDRSPPYGAHSVSEHPVLVDAIRLPNRADTPPPPYHECRINM